MHAEHPRTRERFLAPHDIAAGSNTTQVAARIGRCDESVLRWLQAYNDGGPDAVVYQHTGGHPPFALPSKTPSTARSARPSRRRRPSSRPLSQPPSRGPRRCRSRRARHRPAGRWRGWIPPASARSLHGPGSSNRFDSRP